ncbi:hypothetical protein F5888DRAFT_1907078 [Russula emetica]|nr:hypothetical protein F5888DRAFT_1907078 [Russula emetica]
MSPTPFTKTPHMYTPPQRASVKPPVTHRTLFGVTASLDYGCLIFLWADPTRGALQVFLPQQFLAVENPGTVTAVMRQKGIEEGMWITVDPIPGCMVCNIGEMWEVWTNGLYRSTVHHVIHRGSNYWRSFPKPSASIYAHLLDVYMTVNDIKGAHVVFDEFWKDEANPMSARAGHIHVWNSMINAYLRAANPGATLDLLGEMLDTEAGVEFGLKDVPAPAMSTITQTIKESTEMDPWLCAIHALHVGVRPEPLPCRTEEYDWVMRAVDELLDEYLWFA